MPCRFCLNLGGEGMLAFNIGSGIVSASGCDVLGPYELGDTATRF